MKKITKFKKYINRENLVHLLSEMLQRYYSSPRYDDEQDNDKERESGRLIGQT